VLLHNGSNGTFEASIEQAITDSLGAAQPNAVAIADINGDGKPDLLIADGNTGSSQSTGVIGVQPGNLIVMLQDAANPGHFTQSQTLPLGPPNTYNRGVRIAVGDLNGDGLVDVAVTNFDVNGQNGVVSIFFQDPSKPGTFLPVVNLDAASEPSGIVIADVNGDGVPDIVIASEGQTSDNTGVAGATILLNSKDHPGTFGAPVTYAGQYGDMGLAVGDLNGDGLPDIVLTSANYPQGTGSITVMLNQKSAPGTFVTYGSGSAATLGTGTYPGLGHTNSVAIGDLNGDGVPDLAIADGTGICIMLGDKSSPGNFGTIAQVGG